MGNIQKLCKKDDGLSKLHLAAKRGDTKAVRRLLMLSANVNTLDKEHNTPLHYASLYGHADVVNLLLSQNATVNTGNSFDQTLLHLASKHIAAANSLSNSNTDINAVCRSQASPLHVAVEHGHDEIVENLIFNGSYVNLPNKAKMTALHLACQNGHISIVEILLDNHATVDVMTQSDETPFYLAAKNGHANVTDLLLSREVCDFVLTGDYEETPLHAAVKGGHTEVVEVILEHSRRISGKLINCRHKLQANAESLNEANGIQQIQLSRSDGRRLSAGLVWSEENKPLEIWEDQFGRTALLIAVESNQPKMVKLLLNADQGTYTESHLTLAFFYLRHSRVYDMVTDCRNNNDTSSDLNDAEKYDMFSKNIKEIAQALFSSSKFTVNHQNGMGGTPIFEVIEGIGCFHNVPGKKIHMIDFIHLLLEKDADFNLRNSKGETPLMIASKRGCYDAIQILFDWERKSGTKLELNARDQYGETALMKAVASNDFCHAHEIEFDWRDKSGKKRNIETKDRDGEIALIKTVERNHVSVMRLLLDHKASVNVRDYYGFNALHTAIYEPNTNWFDLHFFCKDLPKRHFDGVDPFATSSGEKLTWGGESIYPHQLIDWLQCHIELIKGTILSRKDLLELIGRQRSDPHYDRPTVFHRQLSNLRLRLEAAKLLLDNVETNVNAKDFRGYKPLDLTMEAFEEIYSTSLIAPKNNGAVRNFQEAPLEVARIDNRGRNPLHRLVISRISDCLFEYNQMATTTEEEQSDEQFDFMLNAMLLSRKNFRESVTGKDYKGRIPLHYVAMLSHNSKNKNLDRIKVLLKIGSEVNAVDIYGKTPLHYAEEDELYELLVHCRADENRMDNFGYSPRDLKRLRDLVIINTNNAKRSTDMELYSSIDIAQMLNTNHVTELTSHRLVEMVQIYSQSHRPQESSEEEVWKIWTKNEFIRLNNRLKQLKPSVKHFIERLADDIKDRDWRFECQPILVGSAEEETKIVISADFDFNFRLFKFSQICDPLPHPQGQCGYFELRRKTNEDTRSRNDREFDCFFNSDNYLLTDKVNSRFKVILEEVLSDTDLWQGEHLFDWNMKHKYRIRYGHQDGLCTAILLKMIHPIADGEGGFLFLDISIDIVACVHVDDWRPEDALPIDVSPAVKTDGCTFVFHRPNIELCRSRGSHFIFSRTFARISFAPLESRVIKESSLLVKAAYTVCKTIPYPERWATYQLKTCLLFCMEALNTRKENETRVEESITPKKLSFWVERIMFCFMEFSRHHVFPCYFMPSFRPEVKQLRDGSIYFKRSIGEKVNKDMISFSYCKSYDLYLDLCPDDTAMDVPVHQNNNRNLDPNDDPLWERFEREDFIRLLSSRRSH